LVLVGAVQAGFFFWQLRLMRQGMSDTKKAADAAKEAADASKLQAALAQKSLTDLERPYIFIFGVGQIRTTKDGDFFVEYTIANYGKMPAIIEGAWIDFVTDNAGKPPSPTLLWEGHSLLVSPILQPGEKRERIKEYTPAGMTDGSVAVILDGSGGPITGNEPVLDAHGNGPGCAHWNGPTLLRWAAEVGGSRPVT